MNVALQGKSHRRQSRHKRAFLRERRRDERWLFTHPHSDECESLGKNFDLSYSAVLKRVKDGYPSIAVDQGTTSGTPEIAGTPVYMVVDAVRHCGSIESARKSYPQLSPEQVKEALAFASAILEIPGGESIAAVDESSLEGVRAIVRAIAGGHQLPTSQNMDALLKQAGRLQGTPANIHSWAKRLADDTGDLDD